MNKQLRSIIDELYALDPELRTQEKELIPILEKLLKFKPDAEPDAAFVQNLRMMLRDKAAVHAEKPRSLFSFFTMPTLNYAITGAVLGAVITGPVVYSLVQSGGVTGIPSDGSAPLFSYKVEETGDEAFGDLGAVSTAGNAYGRGGGGAMGGAPEMDAAMSARPQSGGGGGDVPVGTDARMMIAPDMVKYNLKFDGELPALTAQQVDVLKRQKGISNADVATLMRSFNTGLIDLGSFRNAKADMITLYQDSAYGYMTTISFREGAISLNANWEKWPHPETDCRDEACFQRYRIKESEVPADDVLIGIADAFVREHGIDLTQYGEPEVDNAWRVQYANATDKMSVYIPEQGRVIYPLMVEGKKVYDEGGNASGISVGINVREKKVSDVWGIMDQKYLKSSYDAVTDSAQITSYLENFGKFDTSWMPEGSTVRDVEITLGAPEMGFVKVYSYENNVSDELIVPALIFPVTNVPANEYFYRNAIAVPLAQKMLEKSVNEGTPRPMPIEPLMMEDEATLRSDDE